MKNKRNFLLLSCLFIATAFQSCLKDVTPPITNSEDTHNIIEFGDTGPIKSPSGAVFPLYLPELAGFVNDTAGFYVNVSYSGADKAPTNIDVKLTADPAAIDAYNKEQGTTYVALPAQSYGFPESTTFEKGFNGAKHLRAFIKNGASLKKGVDYAIALKIESASSGTISGNFGTAIYGFTLE